MSYTLDETNNNQGQINFLLVDVDQRVIWTIKQLLALLKATPQMKSVDVAPLEKALDEAERSRIRVADINPPGCVVPPPPPVPPPPGGGSGSTYPG